MSGDSGFVKIYELKAGEEEFCLPQEGTSWAVRLSATSITYTQGNRCVRYGL